MNAARSFSLTIRVRRATRAIDSDA